MVFQKVRAAAEELWSHCMQVSRYARRIVGDNAIVKPLIVREIETQFLQPRFEVPIHLGKEKKIGAASPNGVDRFCPKLGFARHLLRGKLTPDFRKHVIQYQHGRSEERR